jgi:hypothetical protein
MPRLTVYETSDAVMTAGATGIVDVPHPDAAARAKFTRAGRFAVGALRWQRDNEPPDPAAPLLFSLTESVGWLAPDAATADPADVVKQVSFLRPSATVTLDEFRAHYRHHVELARKHMPALWQYVQYDVHGIDGDDALVREATGTVAVSVLWFRSTDDFCNRYFASPEDAAEFASHEGFLDLKAAFTFVATSHPSASAAERP